MARERVPVEVRLWRKVEKSSDPEGCWIWTGATTGTMQYGVIQVGTHGKSRHVRVHRLAYELLVGPIPEGLVLDHTCLVTRCVNPAHLEPVTFRENVLRGDSVSAQYARRTHCDEGHDLAEDRAAGRKRCRLCLNAYHLRRYHERKQQG